MSRLLVGLLVAGLCVSARAEDKPSKAAEEFKRARELSRQELALHRAQGQYNQGLELWYAGKLEEAAAAFRRAIKVKPDYAKAHNNLGAALYHLGKINEAIAHFQRALEIEPGNVDARRNLEKVLSDPP